MAFDLSTAKPEQTSGFDISTAKPEQAASFGEKAVGALEAAGTVASSIVAEPAAGVAGLATSLVPGLEPGSGGAVVEGVREALTFQPRTEAGQQSIQAVGEALQPVGEALQSVESGLGEAVLEATGSPELATVAHTLPTAVLEALGVVGFKGVAKGSARAAEAAGKGLQRAGGIIEGTIESLPQRQTAITKRGRARQSLAKLIDEQAADQRTVGFSTEPRPKPTTSSGKLIEKLRGEGPNVVKNVAETTAESQGFNRSVIATIKDASQETKALMAKMTDIKERGMNRASEKKFRPTDVVGESLMKRINAIKSANTQAGRAIGKAAEDLRGKPVNLGDAALGFDDALADMGVQLIPNGKGGFKPDFELSHLPPGDRGPLKEVVRQMNLSGGGAIDAAAAHRMKKAIDNNVTFGKNNAGISGDAERALKSFRTAIDDALDSTFPKYEAANIQYSETIRALDAFQDVAGRKMDLSNPSAIKATGQLMRRVLSNADSRVRLESSVDEIERIAGKYKNSALDDGGTLRLEQAGAKPFGDDLFSLSLYADELDARFKPVATGSLEGVVGRSTERALKAAASPISAADIAAQVVGKSVEQIRGVTDDTAFKAIRELLKGAQQ